MSNTPAGQPANERETPEELGAVATGSAADTQGSGLRDLDDPSDKQREVEEQKNAGKEFGIGFDGRQFRYRAHRYDRFSDALTYARLAHATPNHPDKAGAAAEWLDPKGPTDDEMRSMEELAISFDGKQYRYEGHRYERVNDAINYARLSRN